MIYSWRPLAVLGIDGHIFVEFPLSKYVSNIHNTMNVLEMKNAINIEALSRDVTNRKYLFCRGPSKDSRLERLQEYVRCLNDITMLGN